MKNVGNSSDGRSQEVPKISGHPCIGRMGALRGHLCDSTAFLLRFLSQSRCVGIECFRLADAAGEFYLIKPPTPDNFSACQIIAG